MGRMNDKTKLLPSLFKVGLEYAYITVPPCELFAALMKEVIERRSTFRMPEDLSSAGSLQRVQPTARESQQRA